MKQGLRIIDSDMHVMEPHDLWSSYLEPRFRERAPGIAKIESLGAWTWQCDGRFLPAFSDDPRRGPLNKARYSGHYENSERYASAVKRRFDAASPLEAMQVEGIDVAVCFRTIGSHGIAMDDLDPEFAAVLCRAFNRWLAERCAAAPERLKGTAILTLQDVPSALAEAQHAVRELGLVALVLPSDPVAGRPWYDEAYDPLWRAACDLGFRLPSTASGPPTSSIWRTATWTT